MNVKLKVCKFGGTSVATSDRIRQIEAILCSEPSRRCVVVSAPGKGPGVSVKVTDLLIKAAQNVCADHSADAEIAEVQSRYRAIYEPLGIPRREIDAVVADLGTRISSPYASAGQYRDRIVAAGEEYNARLFAAYLVSRGVNACCVLPGEAGLFVTEQFGDAQPLPESADRLAALRQRCEESLVVFPGFFGVTKAGHIATFSRGGSDLTGALIAEAIDASEYENWTDVDGIFCCNPVLVQQPPLIAALTYREMRELSYIGFNVLHDEAVRPVMRKNIPIRLRNTFNPANPGTVIVSQRLPTEREVVGIASRAGFCSFTIDKFLMNREKGFGRRMLSILEERDLSYEHCPSGVDTISVILEQSQLTPELVNEIVRAMENGLQPDRIKTEFNIALVSVVGEGLMHKIGVLAQAAAALSQAGINIKMANQGSSEISMIFGIDSEDEIKAVNALYGAFFQTAT